VLGHLERRLIALVDLAEVEGKDSEPVRRERAAIIQKVRRIVRSGGAPPRSRAESWRDARERHYVPTAIEPAIEP
jgi:hypothetical protein